MTLPALSKSPRCREASQTAGLRARWSEMVSYGQAIGWDVGAELEDSVLEPSLRRPLFDYVIEACGGIPG